MARNGTGTYVLPAGQPVVTGTTISSTTHNTLASDLATALTTSICTDGQTPMAATLSMGTNKISNLVAGTLATDAANKAQVDAVTTAFTAADTAITAAYIAADTAITAAYIAADTTIRVGVQGKNFVYNGGMRVAQRGTSYALTTSVGYGSIDRWFALMGATAAGTFAQYSFPGFQWRNGYVAGLFRNNGSSSTGTLKMGQVLETIDSVQLQGQTVILSFEAEKGANFSATSGNITVKICTGTGTDQSADNMHAGAWTGFATPLNTAQSITTGGRFSFSCAIPSSVRQVGYSIEWTPTGTAGAADGAYIGDYQLEIAQNGITSPTVFDYRPYSEDLARCERYYQRVTGSTSMSVGGAASNVFSDFTTRTVMRTTPTAAQVTNNYLFAEANVSSSTSSYYLSPYGGNGYRTSSGAGTSSFSELIGLSAEL